MTKLEFILALNDRLSRFPADEVRQRLSFYSEMIDDRMEDGLSEAEAVAAVGNVDAIAAEITAQLQPEKPDPTDRRAGYLLLLILGSPLWFSLLIVAVSLYISLWAVIVSLWAVFGALAAVTVGLGIFALCTLPMPGLALVAAALVCAGLSIFFFFGCKALTDGTLYLTKKLFARKKEAA